MSFQYGWAILSGSFDCKDGREQSEYLHHIRSLGLIAKMDFITIFSYRVMQAVKSFNMKGVGHDQKTHTRSGAYPTH